MPEPAPRAHLDAMNETPDFLTALPARAVIAVTGPDARSVLQRVITRGPQDLPDGGAQLSALLTPQGKVLCEFIMFDDGQDGLLIDAPASEADALIKRFSLYRLRADAQITRRDDLAVAAARGPGEAELTTVAVALAPDPRAGALGLRAIVPTGGPDADEAAYHAARIAAGVPEFGADYGPAEVFSTDVNHDRMGGIDYKKGCFVGQEVASRMHRKAGVRKRTVRLAFDGAAPEAGSELNAGDTTVGTISSASALGALALVRIDRLAKAQSAGAALDANGALATVCDDLAALEAPR